MLQKIYKGFHYIMGLLFTIVLFTTIVAVILYQSGWIKIHFPKLDCLINHKPQIIYDNGRDGIIKVVNISSSCQCDTVTYKRMDL